jgi:L-amino acid N-acyltransferase YncA
MIRKAVPNDLEQIYRLYQNYSLDTTKVTDSNYAANVQRDGFLIALESKKDIADRIQNDFLFTVFEEDGKVAGFINVNKEIYFPEEANNIIWFDKALKKQYFHDDTSIVLHQIIVDETYKGKGIGKKLLEESIQTLRTASYKDLFSIVTLGPVTNCASILFHTKNGFGRVCVTMPIDLFGLKNYQSLLFHKRI